MTGMPGVKKTTGRAPRRPARPLHDGPPFALLAPELLPSSLRRPSASTHLVYRAPASASRSSIPASTRTRISPEHRRVLGLHARAAFPRSPYDDYGHGTHVAGLIASNGSLSQGQFRGVAPDARLFGFKVLDEQRPRPGSATCCRRSTSSSRTRQLLGDRRHQPVARPPGARAGGHGSARPGRRTRRAAPASSWWRRPATSARTATGTLGYARHHLARQRAVGADGRRRGTQDTARHGDDRDRVVQLARPDVVRRLREAGRRRARRRPGVRRSPKGGQLFTTYPSLLTTAKGGAQEVRDAERHEHGGSRRDGRRFAGARGRPRRRTAPR